MPPQNCNVTLFTCQEGKPRAVLSALSETERLTTRPVRGRVMAVMGLTPEVAASVFGVTRRAPTGAIGGDKGLSRLVKARAQRRIGDKESIAAWSRVPRNPSTSGRRAREPTCSAERKIPAVQAAWVRFRFFHLLNPTGKKQKAQSLAKRQEKNP